MITANRRASATIAFFIPRCLAIFIAQALSHDHLMVFPAEQARIVQLLVARVDLSEKGADITLRTEGLTLGPFEGH